MEIWIARKKIDGWMGEQIARYMEIRIARKKMDGWMDEWMDERMNR